MTDDSATPDQNIPSSARTIHDWLDDYSQYHINPTNKLIHWMCVPVIMVSLMALLWSLPVPAALSDRSVWFNFATLLFVVAMVFYVRLSMPLSVAMGAINAAILFVIFRWHQQAPTLLWQASIAIFVVAWIGQFIGHKIEGKKPAFFQDIQFLLVGPIWLLGFIFRKVGMRY